MKRTKPPKCIERKIQFFAGGRCVKTVRQKITIRQSVKEIGEERLFTRGDTTRMQRRFGQFARIVVTWSAVTSPIHPMHFVAGVDVNAAKTIIRKGMVL